MSVRELEYPFDSDYILKKAKSIKKILLLQERDYLEKKIAVLGGSTTHEVIRILELFLLQNGIKPSFYESEYGQYWQDAMFPTKELAEFCPDIIYIHTSNRNIKEYPTPIDSKERVEGALESTYQQFEAMWNQLSNTYHCPIIQNNMEYPCYRVFGNQDCVNEQGRIHFINALNARFYEYASQNKQFYINDIQYQSSCYGLDQWADPFYWHMYKYALCLPAIPLLSHNVANMIKSIYGKNKKALVLDLDNTLWGGIVGDDGAENLEIGQETSMGQVYSEFQQYIKTQKDLGIMLNVCSKNEYENAILGLQHPDGALKPEDFILIKANWEPKSKNIEEIATELNILQESLVFVDDNPAEREIVRQHLPSVAVPEMEKPESYIITIDRAGYFEATNLSEDDRNRNDMYKANQERKQTEILFGDYQEYLKSLSMEALIREFEPLYLARIAQLTNKSNQFNLTTKRYSASEIEQVAVSDEYISLYGKLEDRFGDNGVVSVVIGKKENSWLHLDLWIMSCRVLKRDMEYAMMDTLVHRCLECGIERIVGYYYPTAKNAMVRDFYELQGFRKEKEDEKGNTIWYYDIACSYIEKNKVIKVVN